MKTNLAVYNNSWYAVGAGTLKRFLWIYVSAVFFQNSFFPIIRLKVFLLRLFGANIGKGVVIKPGVQIKYPWKLKVGDHAWIGEGVWIDNLAFITIGAHSCISQGAYLLTGNHDYKKTTFDLMVQSIELEEGVWIGARSIVCPGVVCRSHAVLTAGSTATKNLEAYTIYKGNPAIKYKKREFDISFSTFKS